MLSRLTISDFDYDLPPELIAQEPLPNRDQSKLLVLHRNTAQIEHTTFANLPQYLRQGDVLVLNNSRVIPARLRAVNPLTGGKFEILLAEPLEKNRWLALVRPAKRAKPGLTLSLISTQNPPTPAQVTILEKREPGTMHVIEFNSTVSPKEVINIYGEPPLPPYIKRSKTCALKSDWERYQTVYAKINGSVAAPTAGLHFTQELLNQISQMGVTITFVTLHVGYGTFAPIKVEDITSHKMHHEYYELSSDTAEIINKAKREGRRIIAVGTTSVRVLETAALESGEKLRPCSGKTNLFIYPPFQFKIVDALITNFHLPKSTLLLLVSAFAAPGKLTGREIILSAYREAIRLRYRFFSYGDAMLIL
jgi:S-adenosylmethionine:tRNA ribosyltransferase-isomerase